MPDPTPPLTPEQIALLELLKVGIPSSQPSAPTGTATATSTAEGGVFDTSQSQDRSREERTDTQGVIDLTKLPGFPTGGAIIGEGFAVVPSAVVPGKVIYYTLEYNAISGEPSHWKVTSGLVQPSSPSTTIVQTQPLSTSATLTLEDIQNLAAQSGGQLVADRAVPYIIYPNGDIDSFEPTGFPRGDGKIMYNAKADRRSSSTKLIPPASLSRVLGLKPGQEAQRVSPPLTSSERPLLTAAQIESAAATPDFQVGEYLGNIPSRLWPQGVGDTPITYGGIYEGGGVTPFMPLSPGWATTPQFAGAAAPNIPLGAGFNTKAILQAAGIPSSGDDARDVGIALNIIQAGSQRYYDTPAGPVPFIDLPAYQTGNLKSTRTQAGFDVYGNPEYQTSYSGTLGSGTIQQLGALSMLGPPKSVVASQIEAAGRPLSELEKQLLEQVYAAAPSFDTLAKGGRLLTDEPVVGVGANSGQPRFIAGEAGPEVIQVTPTDNPNTETASGLRRYLQTRAPLESEAIDTLHAFGRTFYGTEPGALATNSPEYRTALAMGLPAAYAEQQRLSQQPGPNNPPRGWQLISQGRAVGPQGNVYSWVPETRIDPRTGSMLHPGWYAEGPFLSSSLAINPPGFTVPSGTPVFQGGGTIVANAKAAPAFSLQQMRKQSLMALGLPPFAADEVVRLEQKKR